MISQGINQLLTHIGACTQVTLATLATLRRTTCHWATANSASARVPKVAAQSFRKWLLVCAAQSLRRTSLPATTSRAFARFWWTRRSAKSPEGLRVVLLAARCLHPCLVHAETCQEAHPGTLMRLSAQTSSESLREQGPHALQRPPPPERVRRHPSRAVDSSTVDDLRLEVCGDQRLPFVAILQQLLLVV